MQAVSDLEISAAVPQLGTLKAPGPDGFPSLFFQKYSEVVKSDVCAMVREFFDGPFDLGDLNHTNIVLIPKNTHPETISQYRPISLCNFGYKIISKVLANRLKPLLPNLVSQQQSAFIEGRQIHDNIIIAHEVFHYIKHKKKGTKALMALKLDLSKAYDRVRWDFLKDVMFKLGFEEKWINWIMHCVTSVKFSVLANGRKAADVTPSRGLRQGDPLSPYLFLLIADSLSSLLSEAVSSKELGGIRVRNRGPILSHLLFADDSSLFMEASLKNCEKVKEIMSWFGEATREEINFQKSEILFSPNTRVELQEVIVEFMGMGIMKDAAKYLGVPTSWGKSKQETLGYVRDRILTKLQGWKQLLMNPAGKEVLIKDVAETIPAFPMSCFKFPKNLCKQMSSEICRFWWGEKESGNKIHWIRWKELNKPKEVGGLGFKDLQDFNVALLAKQFWRMVKDPNSLWAQVLKASYFPKSSPWEAKRGSSPSWIWTSLLEGGQLLKKGAHWRVGNGHSIDVWNDKWLKRNGCDDALVWGQSSSGNYSVKSGYQLAFEEAYATVDLQGNSSTELSNTIWKVIWRLKSPPRVKHFLWRAIRNAIATKENLFTRKCTRNPLCSLCGIEIESIEHVLLRCEWTRGVWENSGLSFSTPIQNVVSMKRWVEDLFVEFGDKFSDILGTISQICWAIWKQRNEWVFSQQKPNAERTIKRAFQVQGDFWRRLVLRRINWLVIMGIVMSRNGNVLFTIAGNSTVMGLSIPRTSRLRMLSWLEITTDLW